MALSLRDCCVRLGGAVVLDGLSLDVRRGEIVGLAGPNGSGKSTTLSLAAGLLKPEKGRVQVERLGYVPQDTALYDELTAVQNLEFFGQIQGLRGVELDTRIARGLARSRLTQRADDRVYRFSGGMKQRLSIACALMHEPPLLLLDEPTASLDPASRDDLFRDLLQLKDDGHAILLTTHHVEETEAICDRTLVLANGRIKRSPERVTRPLLYGHLRESIAEYTLRELQERFEEDGVSFEVTGRRVRLAAETSEALGRALATLLAEGATLETFRTVGSPIAVRAGAR